MGFARAEMTSIVGPVLVLVLLACAGLGQSGCRSGDGALAQPAEGSRSAPASFAIVDPAASQPAGDEGAATVPEASPPGPSAEGGAESPPEPPPLDYDPELWVEVQAVDPTIVLDIRYATEDNFVGEPLYPCGRCFLRPKAAAAVVEAHQALQAAGYGGLKLFDCYRPTPIQAHLWEITPDPRAVAPPSKGSMHNRGLAIDLTVIDSEGSELDMGTEYDAFSERSYHSFRGLSAQVLANRKVLRESMEAAGFRPLRTEWWHYTLKGETQPLADFIWSCTGPWPGGPRYWERR